MQSKDQSHFFELLSDPEIIAPIPQDPVPEEEMLRRFNNFLDYSKPYGETDKVVWGVYERGQDELIGLCAILTNDEGNPELGYRFRTPYWRRGYGTELTSNIIDFVFNQLNIELFTADVNTANIGSVKILDKFFHPVNEFFNEEDNCTDRRYHLTREEWKQKTN